MEYLFVSPWEPDIGLEGTWASPVWPSLLFRGVIFLEKIQDKYSSSFYKDLEIESFQRARSNENGVMLFRLVATFIFPSEVLRFT